MVSKKVQVQRSAVLLVRKYLKAENKDWKMLVRYPSLLFYKSETMTQYKNFEVTDEIKSASLSYQWDLAKGKRRSLSINFQVIGLSEIKVTSDVQVKANIELPGYNFHYTPSHSSAGGVGIYVRSNLEANKRDDLCVRDADFETVWVEICNPKAKNVICCCVYRHPNSDISKFNDHLHGKIEGLAKGNNLIAIMGDFNIDLLKYDCHSATNESVNMMFSHHFQPAILHPIRITDTSSTIIDNIYVNNATESNIYGGNILSCISDHPPQFTVLYNNAPEYKTSSFYVHDYKNVNEENFILGYNDVEHVEHT
eukprot:gene1792-1997_t